LEQGFVDILKKLVDEQGKTALTDAKKTKAFLADYTKNEYKKESRLLLQAVDAGAAKAIDGADELEPCKKAQIRELEEEHGLNSAWAADIVNTLALVLRGDTTETVSASAEKTTSDPMYSEWHLVRTFEGHGPPVAFSPDGRHIVSASDHLDNLKLWEALKLWETASGRLFRTFYEHGNVFEIIGSVAFSPDGNYIVYSHNEALKLLETASGRLVRTFNGHDELVTSVAFSMDGKNIVSSSWDKTLKLWETESGRLVRTFEGHKDSVFSVAFSPDGKNIVSSSRDEPLKLWETESGQPIRTFEGHKDIVDSVAFSPDGRYIVSGSDDKTIKLWETESGRLIRTFEGHEHPVRSVAFSPDGRHIVSGSYDNTLKLWGEE
jgi:WD40 repeat protein